MFHVYYIVVVRGGFNSWEGGGRPKFGCDVFILHKIIVIVSIYYAYLDFGVLLGIANVRRIVIRLYV